MFDMHLYPFPPRSTRFLDKNKDTLSDDLMQALTGPHSTNPFVVRLMSRAFIEEKKEDGVEEKAALASPAAGAKPGPPVSRLGRLLFQTRLFFCFFFSFFFEWQVQSR